MRQMWKDLYTEVVAEKYKIRNRREMLYSRNTEDLSAIANDFPVSSESRARKMYEDLRTKLYDRKCVFLEWSESEENNRIDRVSQLPLSHIHLACHDLICYKLEGIDAKKNCEGEKIVFDIGFWKEFNASLQQTDPEYLDSVLVSGSIAEDVDLRLSIIDTQQENFPDDSNVIENSDKDVLFTLKDYVVAFQVDEQRKILGIVETEKV